MCKLRIVSIIKNKDTGKTIGYRVEHQTITQLIKKQDIIELFKKFNIENATLVNNEYIRGRGFNLPIEYLECYRKSRTRYRDFTDFSRAIDVDLGGVGRKIVVYDGSGNRYILKFPKEKLGEVRNEHITEFLGSKLAKAFGYPVQEVELGYYKNEECVAIKMFDSIPVTYEGLGDSTLEGVSFEYNLDWLTSLVMNNKFSTSQKEYDAWVMRVFVLDMFLSNFDRHENNWGFFSTDKGYKIAPLYDFGACLYPKLMDSDANSMNDNDIKHLIQFQSRSAILYEGKKKNYFELLRILINDTNSKLVANNIRQLMHTYQRSNLEGLFNYVISFNQKYANYIKFVKRMLDIKHTMLIKEFK